MKNRMPTTPQIKEEAFMRYNTYSKEYYSFIYGAEWMKQYYERNIEECPNCGQNKSDCQNYLCKVD